MKSDDIFSQNLEYSIDFSKTLFRNFFFKSMLSNLYEEHSARRIIGPTDTQT